MDLPRLFIISPCFNEEALLINSGNILAQVLKNLLENNLVSLNSRILLVDDGSTDSTWSLIKELTQGHSEFLGIKLSRNFGHQRALLAGMLEVSDIADYVITLDVDLQDDVNVIEEMLLKAKAGAKIVYGIRTSRTSDTFLKRHTATVYYKILTFISSDSIANHGDFRLLSRPVLQVLKSYREYNLFLRGIISNIGFKKDYVLYERKERLAGNTKYSWRKMVSLAMEGITSASTAPLRAIAFLGLLTFLFSVLMSFWAFYTYLRVGGVPGWTSTVIPMYFLGGVQMLSLGILGEYLGKIYTEIKARPRYIVEKRLGNFSIPIEESGNE